MSEWADQEAEIADLITKSIEGEPERWRTSPVTTSILCRDDGINVTPVSGGAMVMLGGSGMTVSGERGNELAALVKSATRDRAAKGVDAILNALRGK